jgi:hypothetical protein
MKQKSEKQNEVIPNNAKENKATTTELSKIKTTKRRPKTNTKEMHCYRNILLQMIG